MVNPDFRMTFQLSPEAQEALESFGKGLRKIVVAFQAAADEISRRFAIWRLSAVDLQSQIRELARAGRGEGDTRGWQSYVCAAWLHDSCLVPELTLCQCTCHGGDFK